MYTHTHGSRPRRAQLAQPVSWVASPKGVDSAAAALQARRSYNPLTCRYYMTCMHACVCVYNMCVHIYIYIYIHI